MPNYGARSSTQNISSLAERQGSPLGDCKRATGTFAYIRSSPELIQTKQKAPPDDDAFAWQDLGNRNITFTDELDFEIAELTIIYKVHETNDR